MFRCILVAADGSDRGLAAVGVGRLLAEHSGASLVVLRMTPRRVSGEHGAADGELQRLVGVLRETGLSVTERVASGPPARAIVAAARRERADLIVMTSLGRTRLGALGLAGGSMGLLSRSPVPLLIMPTRAEPGAAVGLPRGTAAPIVVPLDGSVAAERALPVAVDAAKLLDEPLLLVRVAQPLLSSGVAESEARAYLDALRRFVAAEGSPQVATSVVTGPPAEAILWTAEGHGACLIVMSTRGRGAVARATAGSVAAQVGARATVPVLLVPTRAAARRPAGQMETEAPGGTIGDVAREHVESGHDRRIR